MSSGDSIGDNSRSQGSLSGQRFSSFDKEQDRCSCNCALAFGGGWWFTHCGRGLLNGNYVDGGTISYKEGIIWFDWKGYYYSLKRTEMKIKPN